MASNLIKGLNNKNKVFFIKIIQNLSSISVNKTCLSTDKSMVKSNSLEVLEAMDKKMDNQMKEKVLDRKTHTGQTFTEDDYRLVRFVGKQKEINPRFAIDLIAEVPPIATKAAYASCDGGGGPLGHPKVFINIDDSEQFGTCGYCGLRFYREGHSHH